MKRNIKKRGFTLVELLVTIAIITLLSSFIIGTVSAARTNAVAAKASSDLFQLQRAIELYRDINSPPLIGADNYFWDHCANDTFKTGLQPLVDNGLISSIPRHPLNKSAPCGSSSYYYYYTSEGVPGLGLTGTGTKCGGKPVVEYMIMVFSREPLPGFGGLSYADEYGGAFGPEWQCIGV